MSITTMSLQRALEILGSEIIKLGPNDERFKSLQNAFMTVRDLASSTTDRHAFIIPDGCVVVRDSEGRATGEVRSVTAQTMMKDFEALSAMERYVFTDWVKTNPTLRVVSVDTILNDFNSLNAADKTVITQTLQPVCARDHTGAPKPVSTHEKAKTDAATIGDVHHLIRATIDDRLSRTLQGYEDMIKQTIMSDVHSILTRAVDSLKNKD